MIPSLILLDLKNLILVPSQYQAQFGKEGVQVEGFESAIVHYVDKIHTQFSNYVGHNNQYEDPILYVIVDDYSMVPDFYNSLRKVIRNDADLESFNLAMNDFNNNVAQIPRLNAQDVYNQMMVRLKTEKMTFGILFLATLFITTIFTYLMTYTFIEHSKKVLAIKMLHGYKLAKQYSLFFTAYFLSIISIILIITSYNRTIDSWNRSYLAVEPRFMLIIICFVLTIQVLVL